MLGASPSWIESEIRLLPIPDRGNLTPALPPDQWQSLSTLPLPRDKVPDSPRRLRHIHPLRIMSQLSPNHFLYTLGLPAFHIHTLDMDRHR